MPNIVYVVIGGEFERLYLFFSVFDCGISCVVWLVGLNAG